MIDGTYNDVNPMEYARAHTHTYIDICRVTFSGQAQDAWDLRTVSPVQWIYRERAKELDFSIWTTIIMVFFMIKLGWTEFFRKDWSSTWNEELCLVPLVCCWGGPHPFCFPPLLFIVVSFLMGGVPRVSTCPISLSLQLLGVVVKAERYGYVKHKALNIMMAAFPSDISHFSVVLFYF